MMVAFAGIAASDNSTIIGIGSGSGTATLPITVTNGSNVGSVDITLTFDPAITTITGMSGGDMDSEFWNIGTDQVRVGAYQTNNPGLNDTFTIANVTFKSVSSSGSCPLAIVVTTFKDATPTGAVMPYDVSNGTYTATSGGNGGGNGVYPPTPTPTENGNVTPTITPTETPTIAPTPSPTKITPNGDEIDEDFAALGKIVMAIIALLIAAVAIILRIRKRKE